jgi:hypothetical protein
MLLTRSSRRINNVCNIHVHHPQQHKEQHFLLPPMSASNAVSGLRHHYYQSCPELYSGSTRRWHSVESKKAGSNRTLLWPTIRVLSKLEIGCINYFNNLLWAIVTNRTALWKADRTTCLASQSMLRERNRNRKQKSLIPITTDLDLIAAANTVHA